MEKRRRKVELPSPYDQNRRASPRFAHALELHVFSEGERQDCSTLDISLSGAYVITDRPAPENSVVRVRVTRGLEDPIEWMGRVRHVVESDQATEKLPAGMGVQIFGIGDQDWDRWVWVMTEVARRCEERDGPSQSRRDGPPASEQPRAYPRYPTPVEVTMQGMPGLFRFVARDISAGGMFVNCRERPAPDSQVDLVIRHPISGQVFTLEGRVVRATPSGIGVEFLNLTAARRKLLHRFIVSGRTPG